MKCFNLILCLKRVILTKIPYQTNCTKKYIAFTDNKWGPLNRNNSNNELYKESHTRKEGALVAGRRQMIVSFYFSRKYPSKRQKSERNTYLNGSNHTFLSDKHNSLVTNNLSNEENWSKSKKLNDFSSITPAI